MVFLISLLAVIFVGVLAGYLILGRNRYGGDRPARLELTASKSALAQGSMKPVTVPLPGTGLFHQALALRRGGVTSSSFAGACNPITR